MTSLLLLSNSSEHFVTLYYVNKFRIRLRVNAYVPGVSRVIF